MCSALLLCREVTDLFEPPQGARPRLTGHDCDRLRHVPRRRSAGSLPSYRAVPTREKVETTHREIIAAAVHAFRVRGYTATKMSTVAAIAGVSPRTLYRYFGSKSELFAATVAESAEQFLLELFEQIPISSLRDAIVGAIESADIELTGESREMMRLAASDEKAWRYLLGATSQLQPMLATALQDANDPEQSAEPGADEQLLWEVRASALLGAITTAYRRWATATGGELSSVITIAVDAVLPVITSPRRHRPTTNPSSSDPHRGIQSVVAPMSPESGTAIPGPSTTLS
jgi:AcrR family transcriptional regulator